MVGFRIAGSGNDQKREEVGSTGLDSPLQQIVGVWQIFLYRVRYGEPGFEQPDAIRPHPSQYVSAGL